MDKFILSAKKRTLVPGVLIVVLLGWLGICYAHYMSYWHGTIFRVQTTDFNLLHRTLPPLISRMILEGRDDLIQETLNATYGLFGLVITDATGSNILYKTDRVYHHESWQSNAHEELLNKCAEPYDLLLEGAPMEPSYGYESPRSRKAVKLPTYLNANQNSGQILGRLYYFRTVPPSFAKDIGAFLVNPFEMSASRRGYLYISVNSLTLSAALLLLIWLRRRGLMLKQKEIELVRSELNTRKKILEQLTGELNAQKSRKAWLEKEADRAYKRALGLRNSLEKLKESLSVTAAVASSQNVMVEMRDSKYESTNEGIKVRPPSHPSSGILDEIDALLPGLSENASALKQQASVLNDYCATLEHRQFEMQRIVDNAFSQSMGAVENLDPHQMLPGMPAPEVQGIDMRPS